MKIQLRFSCIFIDSLMMRGNFCRAV